MTSDQNKGITAITYNHLNLPVQVNKGASDYIVYTYDAGGRKLSQQVFGSTPKITDYMGEFIYEGNVLQFVNTEEGRIVMTGANPEYQYHLKDHLGNVRTTFTTVTTPEVNTATYETANLTAEMGKFLRMDKARRVNSTLFDRTNGSSPGFAERLNGTTNEKYGLARSIAVSSGDVVSAEVYAKYPDTNSANWLPALSTLMGNIATNTGNIVVDGSNYANGNNPFNALFAQAHTPSGTAPQAYLNCLPAVALAKAGMVFDKNWNLISSKSGYMQITTAGRETGSDVAHERLFTPSISITEPGYVYIYVSNEDLAAPKDVFLACPDEAFRGIGDDFSVTQVKTPIVQVEDYYPFGLTFNSYQRDSSMPDQYLYNGKELQDELSLGWLDYGARMYMPELGRWGVVDPHVEKYESINPYSYNYSNPIRFVDLFGRDPGDIVVLFSGADFGQGKTGSTVAIENEVRKDVNGGKVVSYSSSYYKNLDDGTQEAYDEILRTHKENPKGRILLYGYSYGGVLVNHLAKRLAKAEIQVSVMVTVDAANGWGSDNVDRTISSNVHVNENFFELNPKFTRDPTLSHGHANSGNPGQVKNHDKSNDSYEGEKMDHMNIDEATMKDAVQIFTNILKCLTDGDRKDYDSDQVKELLKKKK